MSIQEVGTELGASAKGLVWGRGGPSSFIAYVVCGGRAAGKSLDLGSLALLILSPQLLLFIIVLTHVRSCSL